MKESAYLASIAQEPSRMMRLVHYLRPRPRKPAEAPTDLSRLSLREAWDMGYSAGQKRVRFELGESAPSNPFESKP